LRRAGASKEKVQLTTKVGEDVRDLVVQVARVKGIDPSQYIRSLIIEDLDRRHLFDARIRSIGAPQA
jgi:hypothetical protein